MPEPSDAALVPRALDLARAFEAIDAPWSPRLAADVSGHHVRLARLEGPFLWHQHEAEDELFLVVTGRLRMEFRSGSRTLGPGQLIRVPAGLEHRPVGEPSAEVLIFEPGTVASTGEHADDPRRVIEPDAVDAGAWLAG